MEKVGGIPNIILPFPSVVSVGFGLLVVVAGIGVVVDFGLIVVSLG